MMIPWTYLLIFLVIVDTRGQDLYEDDVVVADAVFKGVYIGIVRLVQKVDNGSDGALNTHVWVNLGHKNNDSTTDNHMWHVEHDPITGVDCAANNKHFAPFGITKITNYTQYCSSLTPDFCEIGDISTKTNLTSVGTQNAPVSVPMLPLVGPYTVIGHSVNVHGGNKSKQREACANIVLNQRKTPAKLVDFNVKIPDPMDMAYVNDARRSIARELMIPMQKIQTAGGLGNLSLGCTTITFLLFDRNIVYCEVALRELRAGKRDIGPLTPVGCVIDGVAVTKPEQPRKDCSKSKNGGVNQAATLAVLMLSISSSFGFMNFL